MILKSYDVERVSRHNVFDERKVILMVMIRDQYGSNIYIVRHGRGAMDNERSNETTSILSRIMGVIPS